jgi:hypothetical protein
MTYQKQNLNNSMTYQEPKTNIYNKKPQTDIYKKLQNAIYLLSIYKKKKDIFLKFQKKLWSS